MPRLFRQGTHPVRESERRGEIRKPELTLYGLYAVPVHYVPAGELGKKRLDLVPIQRGYTAPAGDTSLVCEPAHSPSFIVALTALSNLTCSAPPVLWPQPPDSVNYPAG